MCAGLSVRKLQVESYWREHQEKMDKIRVFFILPTNCADSSETSDVMIQAFETCKQNVINVSWIEEAKLNTADLVKTDFVVFEDFQGGKFEALKENKCARILGPWCILICLMDGIPIPNFNWPIYNMAMSGCVISCSHLSKPQKEKIKEQVQLMGGCYSDSLMTANTHLVTETVKSEKYLQAAESGVKLMVSDWVKAVHEASLKGKVHCNDEEFSKYRCLPFHKLTVCSTGFPSIEMRSEVAQLVAKYGGVFTGTLNLSKTDVLIVYGDNGILSQKYKAARGSPNVFCVSLDWVHDSIAKGYALPHHLYKVKKITSTPTKVDETIPNFSMISALGENDKYKSTFEETKTPKSLVATFMTGARISPNKRKHSIADDVEQLIDGLDIKKAKRAGQYLDGCSVYVAGFKPEQREKLCKILNLSGATRYDDISDRLTHIIVGDPSCHEVKIIKSKSYPISLVSIYWLMDSMAKQQAVDEENYLINLYSSEKEQFSSPLGRKGINLLRSNKTLTSDDLEAADTKADVPEVDTDLMQQYRKTVSKDEDTDTLVQYLNAASNFDSKPEIGEQSGETSNSSRDETSQSSDLNEKSSQQQDIFFSKKFLIINFSSEESQYIRDVIENASGSVMSKTYRGIPDYVVAPMFIHTHVQVSALEVVNILWIQQSIQEREECPILYFHRPMVINTNEPLKNCIVSISGYAGYERNFIQQLTEELGGVFQEQLARIARMEKNLLASTHLISLEADGKKYKAALKWGLFIVNKDWILECAKTGKLVSVNDFLVGESKRTPCNEGNNSVCNSSAKSSPFSTSKRILTPLNQKQPLDISKTEKTPLNKRLFDGVRETPGGCSQVTPVSKLMEEVRRTSLLGTPQSPPMPKCWYDIKTPESPFGAFIRPHLSPESKKELMRYINRIPDFVPPPQERKSTPLSEVKRRCWKKLLGQETPGSPSTFPTNQSGPSKDSPQEQQDLDEIDEKTENKLNEADNETTAENSFMHTKLKQIEQMANALGASRRNSRPFQSAVSEEVGTLNLKDSQPFTVGWDYNDDPPSQIRIFMLSGIEKEVREDIVRKIESLGAEITELSAYDPKCTHLICPKPARNEKTLACMAAGKWILHTSYVDKSVEAEHFLNEEEFEFGNPKSRNNIKLNCDGETEMRNQAMYWWRKEISRRGYGAFNDMRAIVVAQKRDPLVRVIEAGGGQVLDIKPPFNKDVHATHCLLEVRSVPDFSLYNPLAQQGILCINTTYISDFLYRSNKDIKDSILPHYSSYYH